MTRKQRFEAVINYFETARPEVETELNFESPYQLLVAVILSAQCTDKRVNEYTPALFRRYPDAAALAAADYDELFSHIKSISFPGNKTRHQMGTKSRPAAPLTRNKARQPWAFISHNNNGVAKPSATYSAEV